MRAKWRRSPLIQDTALNAESVLIMDYFECLTDKARAGFVGGLELTGGENNSDVTLVACGILRFSERYS
jgi:hypothetical protein